jgi:PAS domain S-box-containing protein
MSTKLIPATVDMDIFPTTDEIQQLFKENQHQKALLEAIFEAMPCAVAVLLGEELSFTYVNPTYRFLCPDPMIDPVGKPYDQVWPERGEHDYRERYARILQTGQPFQVMKVEHTFADQTQRIFTIQARRIQWDDQPACLVLMWDTTEETLAYKQADQDRAQLQAVLEALPVGVVILDRQGGILQTNPMYKQIWGVVPPKVQGVDDYVAFKAWWVDSGDVVQAEEWASAQAVQKGVAVYGQELLIQRFDGQLRYVLNSGVPILDAKGEIIGSVVAILDITEMHEAETALQVEKATLQSILNATKESIWLFSPEGIILMGNQTALSRLKRSAEEAIGKRFEEVIPPALAEARQLRVNQVVETGQNVEFEDERAGINFLHNFYPVFDLAGKVRSVACFSRDITENKKSQQAILESEERFRVITEAIPVGVGVVGLPEGEFLFVNKAYRESFGYEPSELLGRKTLDIYWDPDDRKRILEELKKHGNVADYEVKLKRKDGSMFWAIASTRPITYQGKPALLGVFMDITERVRAEEQQREQERKYQELFRDTQAEIVELRAQIELQRRLLAEREAR